MHLAYIWIVSHLSAKNYRNWWKFDEVLTKTNLLSFFGTRCITKDLSSEHVSEITANAHKSANCILRCFASRDVNLLVRAFIVYVRPILEYNSVIWSPFLKKEVSQIEKVKRRFTKRLRGLSNVRYTERLSRLGLPTLELRRLQLDLIFRYKIVFGLTSLTS